MYRRYEDPWKVEDMLKDAEEKLARIKADMDQAENEGGFEFLFEAYISAVEDVAELRDRVRFAWDDQEYDENCALYGY